jgi:hypothetical protein
LEKPQKKVVFESPNLTLDLRYIVDQNPDSQGPERAGKEIPPCHIGFEELDLRNQGHKGLSACLKFTLHEGNVVTFVLRDIASPSKTKEAETQDALTEDHPLLRKARTMDSTPDGENPGSAKIHAEIGTNEVLLRGASAMRPPDDPILTPVSYLVIALRLELKLFLAIGG